MKIANPRRNLRTGRWRFAEAFEAPDADFLEIGDSEWLMYFVTGNDGTEPVFLKQVDAFYAKYGK